MMEVAKKERLRRVYAEVQNDNLPMIRLLEGHGFKSEIDAESGTVRLELLLRR